MTSLWENATRVSKNTTVSTCGTVRVGRLHGIAEGVASNDMDGDEVLTDGDKVRDDNVHAVPRTTTLTKRAKTSVASGCARLAILSILWCFQAK